MYFEATALSNAIPTLLRVVMMIDIWYSTSRTSWKKEYTTHILYPSWSSLHVSMCVLQYWVSGKYKMKRFELGWKMGETYFPVQSSREQSYLLDISETIWVFPFSVFLSAINDLNQLLLYKNGYLFKSINWKSRHLVFSNVPCLWVCMFLDTTKSKINVDVDGRFTYHNFSVCVFSINIPTP